VALSTAIRGHETLHRLEGRARWLASILGGVGDAIVVTDPQGRIAHWTPRAAALTGRDDEAALGQCVHEVLRGARTADAASLRSALERSLGEARPEILGEMEMVGAGGGRRTVRGETTPLLDAQGVLEGLVVVLREVSHARGSDQVG
jgi:PAS domain S-box-containing protein